MHRPTNSTILQPLWTYNAPSHQTSMQSDGWMNTFSLPSFPRGGAVLSGLIVRVGRTKVHQIWGRHMPIVATPWLGFRFLIGCCFETMTSHRSNRGPILHLQIREGMGEKSEWLFHRVTCATNACFILDFRFVDCFRTMMPQSRLGLKIEAEFHMFDFL